MTQSNDESLRLDQLELKMMDIEVTVQQLNDVILQQYRDIEQLRLDNSTMQRKLESINDSSANPAPIDEVPPHY